MWGGRKGGERGSHLEPQCVKNFPHAPRTILPTVYCTVEELKGKLMTVQNYIYFWNVEA